LPPAWAAAGLDEGAGRLGQSQHIRRREERLLILEATGSAIAAAAAQRAPGLQAQGEPGGPDLPEPVPEVAQAAVDRRGAKLSPEAAIQAQASEEQQDSTRNGTGEETAEAGASRAGAQSQDEEGADGLTPAEERQVQALRQRDAEVRRHEQAHAAVGGAYAGAPQYQYTTGPDGRRYAIGGEVSIDAGAVPGNPQATIAKLQTVKRAALAPGNPSPQDRRVAAQADLSIAQARIELREERAEEAKEQREETGAVQDPASTENTAATEGAEPGAAAAAPAEIARSAAPDNAPACPPVEGVERNGSPRDIDEALPAETDQPAQVQPQVPGALLNLVV